MEQDQRRILVVDDDPEIRVLIAEILDGDGYDAVLCVSGEQAVDILEYQEFDLILADIKMPHMSGIELLNFVRRMSIDSEVILMTAYASVETAVEALRGQAVDYLVKPFRLPEFRERIEQAMCARPPKERISGTHTYLELTVDFEARRVWAAGREVVLTRLEFDLLGCLFERLGRPVSSEALLSRVWRHEPSAGRSPGTVKQCISRLRTKIGDDAQQPHLILNVRGVGYQLGA